MSKNVRTLEQLKDSRLLYEKKLPRFGYLISLVVTILLIFVVIWSIYTPKIYVVKSSGLVQSDNKNYVMSPFTGRISEMLVTEGKVVDKGDALFEVQSTELNLQITQLKEQRKSYKTRISQFEKLVKSIKDNNNYFDITNENDNLYYSQYEVYKSMVAQNQVDVSTYKAYGYTDEQIENQLVKNQAKVVETYNSAIQSAENSIMEANTQIDAINAQLTAAREGQDEYTITANTSGLVHMMSDYKEGMVVQAASPIASIASAQDTYSIIANMSLSDVAKIQVGDCVDIAVAGLAQSIYGTITGKVINIDSDITTSQNLQTGNSSSYFKVQIRPNSMYLVNKQGNKVNITNGMEVEARIQYDEITYFNYVLEALGVLTK